MVRLPRSRVESQKNISRGEPTVAERFDPFRKLVVKLQNPAHHHGEAFELRKNFLVRQLAGEEDLDQRGAAGRIQRRRAASQRRQLAAPGLA